MLDFNKVKEDVKGKWPGIMSTFGIDVGDGKHRPCPMCRGGKDRFRWIDKGGTGSWYCSKCSPNAGDGWSLLQRVLGIDFKEACLEVGKIIGTVKASPCQKEKTISPDVFRKMYLKSIQAIKGGEVSRYLYYRGLTKIPKTLRYSTECWEPETKKNQKAMLAIFHSSEGEAITIHRTYLDKHANKLKIESPKKIMPPLKKMAGGACRLYKYEEGVIGIAEGIETAIAVHNHLNIPCWASLTATLMEKWEPPKEARRIRIFADNDRNFTGQKVAYCLANKIALLPNREVEVFIPDKIGTDFLDQWI